MTRARPVSMDERIVASHARRDLWPRLLPKIAVDPVTGCHPWIAYRNREGYGGFNLGWRGAMAKAHRVVYVLSFGVLPVGFEVDHLCAVRYCVNPLHLQAVTHAENVRRTVERGGRPGRAVGEPCPRGHDLSREVIRSNGLRRCRDCHNDANRLSRQRKRAAA